jgi:hypothetical protein
MSTPQAGETVLVRVKASRPAPDSRVVRTGYVVAEFWAPGTDTSESPDHCAPCFYAESSAAWVAVVDTTGWEPGVWTLRGRVTSNEDDATGWSWGTLPLSA